MAFLALRGLWGIPPETPEDFYLSQLEGADMVNCKQTSFDLLCLVEMRVISERKKTMF